MAEKKNGTGAAGITKKDAVARALSTLGHDAMPKKIQEWVKGKFGIEMTNDHVSVCKREILHGSKTKPAMAKPATKHAPAKQPVATPKPSAKAAPNTESIGLEDVETVKDLVERVGAPSLRQLIDVMAR